MTLVNDWVWLDVPDFIRIFLDRSVRGKLAHVGSTANALLGPLRLVLVSLVNSLIGSNVRRKVGRDQVKVLSDGQGTDQRLEDLGVLKNTFLNGRDNTLEGRVHRDATVTLSMAQVLHLVGHASKDEDVVLTNLLQDLNVGAIQGSNNEASVQDKLHIGSSRRLSTSSGYVLFSNQYMLDTM